MSVWLQFDCFLTLLTGNLMYAARAISDEDYDTAVFHASIIAAFCLVVWGAVLFETARATQGQNLRRRTRLATILAVFLLAVLVICDLFRWKLRGRGELHERWAIVPVSIPIGFVTELVLKLDDVNPAMITVNIMSATRIILAKRFKRSRVLMEPSSLLPALHRVLTVLMFTVGIAAGAAWVYLGMDK